MERPFKESGSKRVDKPLAGKRILVPPARPEVNPLLLILKKRGADVLAFPVLKIAPPVDYSPMDRAIQQLDIFDWIIFSGTNCVENFLNRMITPRSDRTRISRSKIAAIGYGAQSALKRQGVEIDYTPEAHTADGVLEGLGGVSELQFLLVRVEGASRSLPEKLESLGAEVTEVAGYRMLVETSLEAAEKAFGWKPHILALANPTAVRFLLEATRGLGFDLQAHLKGVAIAAVGPVTAGASRSLGRGPDIVSKGHIGDLAQSLTDLFGS